MGQSALLVRYPVRIMSVETTIGEKSQSAEILRHFNRAIPVFIWISPLLAGLLSLHMGKSMAWDLLHYHYYNGYAFLTNRLNFDILPAGNWSTPVVLKRTCGKG